MSACLNRTLQTEWAYRQVFTSNDQRASPLRPGWSTRTLDAATTHSAGSSDLPTVTNVPAGYH